MSLMLSPEQISLEIDRILEFLSARIQPGQKTVLGLSGGIDSDLTARLAVLALGPRRVKLFTVIQTDMEPGHLNNARLLAIELGVPLVELALANWASGLIDGLCRADPGEGFSNEAALDIGRARNCLRTAICSTYHDRGYLSLASSNRTEIECGFLVRLADGIWHLGPLAHLYKTQVYQLAAVLGSSQEVIRQPASAGYWPGESDLEDLAYWLVNQRPIGAQRSFSVPEIALAQSIRAELTFERLDSGLQTIAAGCSDPEFIAANSGLSVATSHRLLRLTAAAREIAAIPVFRTL